MINELLSQAENNRSIFSDDLNLPFNDSSADFVLSIAGIHHFSTEERRRKRLVKFRMIKPNGRILMCVWAMNKINSKILKKICGLLE